MRTFSSIGSFLVCVSALHASRPRSLYDPNRLQICSGSFCHTLGSIGVSTHGTPLDCSIRLQIGSNYNQYFFGDSFGFGMGNEEAQIGCALL